MKLFLRSIILTEMAMVKVMGFQVTIVVLLFQLAGLTTIVTLSQTVQQMIRMTAVYVLEILVTYLIVVMTVPVYVNQMYVLVVIIMVEIVV